MVSDFLAHHFARKSRSGYSAARPVRVAGLTIERAGIYVYALEVYGNLESDASLPPELRNFAAQRLERSLGGHGWQSISDRVLAKERG